MKTRRQFLRDAALLGAAATSARESLGAAPAPVRKSPRAPLIWCSAGGAFGGVIRESDRPRIEAFVRKMADLGVRRLIGSDASPILVAAARDRGIQVRPYSQFNTHGGLNRVYKWSLDYTRQPLDLPRARAMMDHHRPTHWEQTPVLQITTDLAREHPELWSRDRTGRKDLRPGDVISLSLAAPEARALQAARGVKAMETSGADGLQLEFVLLNENETVLDVYGFEGPMVEAYRAAHGRTPFSLPDDDPGWLQFKADYVTRTLSECRAALRAARPDATLSVTLIARPKKEYGWALQDWPAWIKSGAIDELCIWFRQPADVREIDGLVKEAAEEVAGRCPLVVELSTFHPGSCLQEPAIIVEAARRALGNGATDVGLYTASSLDQLGLWPAVEAIAKI